MADTKVTGNIARVTVITNRGNGKRWNIIDRRDGKSQKVTDRGNGEKPLVTKKGNKKSDITDMGNRRR